MKKIVVITLVALMSVSAFAKGGGGGHASSSGHSSYSGAHSTTTAKGTTSTAKPAAEPARTTSWFPWFGGGSHGSSNEEKCKKEKTC